MDRCSEDVRDGSLELNLHLFLAPAGLAFEPRVELLTKRCDELLECHLLFSFDVDLVIGVVAHDDDRVVKHIAHQTNPLTFQSALHLARNFSFTLPPVV